MSSPRRPILCPLDPTHRVVGDGYYWRAGDSRQIQRYRCQDCGKRFSSITGGLSFGQKKRRINSLLWHMLCSGTSMRRCARNLQINRKTVERRLIYFAKRAQNFHQELIAELSKTPLSRVQFDDLISSEHTKMKPVTVTLAVSDRGNKTPAGDPIPARLILGIQAGAIPAFGHLASASRKKYGRRSNEHQQTLKRVFENLKQVLHPQGTLVSDEHQRYPEFVAKYFPRAQHIAHKGGRGSIAGQGELKKKVFDPLFAINHTCAVLRANISRLIRRTWNTTKKVERLQEHLEICAHYHNLNLLNTSGFKA